MGTKNKKGTFEVETVTNRDQFDVGTSTTLKREALPITLEAAVNVVPGIQTSEFWITLVSTIIPNLITVLAIFKLVPNEVASTLSAAIVAVVGGLITVFVSLKYIKSRTEVKMKSIETQARMYELKARSIKPF